MAVVIHFVAVIWFIICSFQSRLTVPGDRTPWIEIVEIANKDWIEQYAVSYYWSMTAMMTGGATSNTVYEIGLSIPIMLMVVCMYAYLINKVGLILEEVNQKKKMQQREFSLINTYMSSKKISKELQSVVINYIDYLHRGHSDMVSMKEVEAVMAKLPPNLQQDIQTEVNSKSLKSFSFLSKFFSQDMMKEMINIIQEQYYMPNEVIHTQDNPKEFFLYIVAKGEVELLQECQTNSSITRRQSYTQNVQHQSQYQEIRSNQNIPSEPKQIPYRRGSIFRPQAFLNDNTEIFLEQSAQHTLTSKNSATKIAVKKEGDVFGLRSFVIGNHTQYQARSSNFTTILKINREDFIKILQKNELDNEKFLMLRDQIITQNQSNLLLFACEICQQPHFETQCPLVQYLPNRLNIIRKQERQKQNRLIFTRKLKRQRKFRIDDQKRIIFSTVYLEQPIDTEQIQYESLQRGPGSVENTERMIIHIHFLVREDIYSKIWDIIQLEDFPEYQENEQENQSFSSDESTPSHQSQRKTLQAPHIIENDTQTKIKNQEHSASQFKKLSQKQNDQEINEIEQLREKKYSIDSRLSLCSEQEDDNRLSLYQRRNTSQQQKSSLQEQEIPGMEIIQEESCSNMQTTTKNGNLTLIKVIKASPKNSLHTISGIDPEASEEKFGQLTERNLPQIRQSSSSQQIFSEEKGKSFSDYYTNYNSLVGVQEQHAPSEKQEEQKNTKVSPSQSSNSSISQLQMIEEIESSSHQQIPKSFRDSECFSIIEIDKDQQEIRSTVNVQPIIRINLNADQDHYQANDSEDSVIKQSKVISKQLKRGSAEHKSKKLLKQQKQNKEINIQYSTGEGFKSDSKRSLTVKITKPRTSIPKRSMIPLANVIKQEISAWPVRRQSTKKQNIITNAKIPRKNSILNIRNQLLGLKDPNTTQFTQNLLHPQQRSQSQINNLQQLNTSTLIPSEANIRKKSDFPKLVSLKSINLPNQKLIIIQTEEQLQQIAQFLVENNGIRLPAQLKDILVTDKKLSILINQEQSKAQLEELLMDFDKQKNFRSYYPQFNLKIQVIAHKIILLSRKSKLKNSSSSFSSSSEEGQDYKNQLRKSVIKRTQLIQSVQLKNRRQVLPESMIAFRQNIAETVQKMINLRRQEGNQSPSSSSSILNNNENKQLPSSGDIADNNIDIINKASADQIEK